MERVKRDDGEYVVADQIYIETPDGGLVPEPATGVLRYRKGDLIPASVAERCGLVPASAPVKESKPAATKESKPQRTKSAGGLRLERKS